MFSFYTSPPLSFLIVYSYTFAFAAFGMKRQEIISHPLFSFPGVIIYVDTLGDS